MKSAMGHGVQFRTNSKNYFTLGCLFVFSLGLLSCANDDSDNANNNTQQQLLAELEKNRLLWAQSGVSEYSFSLHKECDCPDELQTQHDFIYEDEDEDDEENLVDTEVTLSKAGGLGGRSITARDEEERSTRSQQTQSLRMESVFSDLRQAILQNSVQQVSYNPAFGFPQNVVVNNAGNRAAAFNTKSDDDDDNRNALSNLSIQTNNFQVLRANNNPQGVAVNGQFIRQSNPAANGAEQFWIVDNDGRWNQVNVPANVFSTINTLPNQSFVQANGQWMPGGVNGLGYVNLQQINQNQNNPNPFQNNLNGTLNYSVLNNGSFDLDDFFVNSDDGRRVLLNVNSNLRNQALQLAGQRVNLTGQWTPFFNDPNARFNPNNFNVVNPVLQQYSGVLSVMSLPFAGAQQSYVLVDDFGSSQQLQIPATIAGNIASYVGQRIIVTGTKLNAGAYGQPVISVQGIQQTQNLFTNTQVSGVISVLLPPNANNNAERVMLQMDTGNTITVQIPAAYRNPYSTLTSGMRIQVSGVWLSNAGIGQGEFEARAPVQIVNLGVTASSSYSGTITNIGAASNGLNCNATQNIYSFTSDNGQQFQLYLSNATQIAGQTTQGQSLPYQARVQVTGTLVSPGVLQAQTVNVYPQNEMTITGTIIEIGAAGSSFTCTGTLNNYRLLDSNGNAYSITTTPGSIVQGSLGSFLRIGDTVQARGVMANSGGSFYASQIVTVATANVNNPYQPLPTPGANPVVIVGTVTGEDCTSTYTDSFHFVDQSGAMYKIFVGVAAQAGASMSIGAQLQVTGTMVGDEVTAQQVVQLQTFADPIVRTPVSGTILSLASTVPSSCNTPVYIYQFQNDNGQMQQLRVTTDAAYPNPQPLANGSRITITARVNSVNPQVIDAIGIQTQFSTGQPFGSPVGVQSTTVTGTVVATSCPNEYYFVDQNGTGYQLQLNSTPTIGYVGEGSKLSVTGQVIGNRLIATSAYPDQSQVFFPTPLQALGTIIALQNTETLNCGSTVGVYTFQNDNGRTQRLRIVTDPTSFTGQLTVGSRILITNKVESFDGSMIDALSITLPAL